MVELIDRPLRPLFPDGYMSETQIIATVFSADPEFDPDVLAMNGASFALTLSDIPWAGPVAAARVGYLNGEYVLNPTASELAQSAMDIVVAGTGAAVVMVEGQTGELSEEVVLDAIFFAHRGIQPLIALQNELRADARGQLVEKALGLLVDRASVTRNYPAISAKLLADGGRFIGAVVALYYAVRMFMDSMVARDGGSLR